MKITGGVRMQIRFTTEDVLSLTRECLVIGISEGTKRPTGYLARLDQKLDGQLAGLLAEGMFLGKKKETLSLYTFSKQWNKQLLLVGLGSKDTFESIREISAHAIRTCLKSHIADVSLLFAGFEQGKLGSGEIAHAMVEGVMLGAYQFPGYALVKEERTPLNSLELICEENQIEQIKKGCELAEALSIGTNLARDLVNTPGNMLTPTGIAEAAVEVAKRYGMEYEVLELEQMKQLGMGALLGVSQGSEQPPKLVAIKYRGRQNWDQVLGLVGKGISFDTGGISLKTREGMEEMIGDMGGAASVIGTLEVLGRLKPQVNVLGILPCAENMPSGTALKPGDVIRSMSGKTIEVLNTDAEGRLVLADGVTYAKKLGVDYIVDIATLTGAVQVALGNCTTGVMTNDEGFVEEFFEAAAEAGEQVWRLPAFDEYKDMIKSKVADLKNTGGRYAGAITAGLFVGAFAEDTPWIHLDIAGTSWAEREEELSPAGGTGAMVRSLSLLALGRSE
jgi:leucyl aminopeptidase